VFRETPRRAAIARSPQCPKRPDASVWLLLTSSFLVYASPAGPSGSWQALGSRSPQTPGRVQQKVSPVARLRILDLENAKSLELRAVDRKRRSAHRRNYPHPEQPSNRNGLRAVGAFSREDVVRCVPRHRWVPASQTAVAVRSGTQYISSDAVIDPSAKSRTATAASAWLERVCAPGKRRSVSGCAAAKSTH
jgi:hypothetical protein